MADNILCISWLCVSTSWPYNRNSPLNVYVVLSMTLCLRPSECLCVCVRGFKREKHALPCPPKCSWMSRPICSLSLRHKWTLHPLVRWLISAPLSLSLVSSPPRIRSAHTPSSAILRTTTHTHTRILIQITLPLWVTSQWRSMRGRMHNSAHCFRGRCGGAFFY